MRGGWVEGGLTECEWQAVEGVKRKERMVRVVLLHWRMRSEHGCFMLWQEHTGVAIEERRQAAEQHGLMERLDGQIKVRQRSMQEAQELKEKLARSEEGRIEAEGELTVLRGEYEEVCGEHKRVVGVVRELEGEVSRLGEEVARSKEAMLKASQAAIQEERAKAARVEQALREEMEEVGGKVGELERLSGERARESEANRVMAMKEVERRLDMSRNVIARMGHIELANAFDHFRERVVDKKHRTEACRRVLGRMLHLQAARAFDSFVHAAERLRQQRVLLSRTVGRWSMPLLEWAFHGLEAGVRAAKAEAAAQAHEAGRAELEEQLQRGSEQVREDARGDGE